MTNTEIGSAVVINGDCIDQMRAMPADSVDAIVTDPPYGLSKYKPAEVAEMLAAWLAGEPYHKSGAGFMAREWDSCVPGPDVWAEALRVLKPGGHMLAFAGSRTLDLMTLAIRLAGFEIRDTLTWLYGSGFPKSLDVGAAIDKAAGAERADEYAARPVGRDPNRVFDQGLGVDLIERRPVTDEARQWAGWGTALKPAHEPIVMARKPAYEPIVMARKPLIGTIAANVLEHGTGGVNIDASRISDVDRPGDVGRWPANVLLDTESAGALGEKARFFYSAKASRGERDAGLEAFAESRRSDGRATDIDNPRLRTSARRNDHPTVKPIDVMRWLVRLVTPPGGVVLDPFAGSGSTLIAAEQSGFRSIGIELDDHYCDLAVARLAHWTDDR